MNFLLQMVGQPHRSRPWRQSPMDQLRAQAATFAAAGDLAGAILTCERLAAEYDPTLGDLLILAHLHLAGCDYAAALSGFTAALDRMGDAPLDSLERLLDSACDLLFCNRCAAASGLLQTARGSIDVLLSAHAGVGIAAARLATPASSLLTPLVSLANLSDLLLRALARTRLVGNVALSLKKRSLRQDLAPWAASPRSIDNLLAAEHRQLETAVRLHPQHAELHYRLGLVARTRHMLPEAAAAFGRVLRLHPHHFPSATRLAATQLQLGESAAAFPLLAVAFAVPPQILQQYAALARAAESPAFDQSAGRFAQLADPDPSAVKANLAFALGELGLLNPARSRWREAVPA
jgi:tetratricopeptide (TPR) repeat protein